jgi:hypothetical protein
MKDKKKKEKISTLDIAKKKRKRYFRKEQVIKDKNAYDRNDKGWKKDIDS